MPQRILIVDDDFLIRWSLGQVLSQAGCEVATAEDGCKGLQKARAQHFDFVITDLSMPVVDGWQLMEKVMDFQFPPKVIVISADWQADHQAKLKEKGVLAYIEKSHLMDNILSLIKENSPTESSTNIH